jgi:hypothetical protein
MAIPLPPISGGSVQPEYAATNISFNRSVAMEHSFIVPVFTASVAYSRIDYLLDSEGKKVGIVNTEIGQPQDPAKYGNLYLNAEETAVQFAVVPPAGQPIGEDIANMVDALIKADLVKRGIITE